MNFRLLAAAATAALLLLPAPSRAQTFSDAQRGEIEKIIKDYLVAHPEVLEEASAELDKRKQLAEAEKAKTEIKNHSEALFNSSRQVTIGNAGGDVTLVEFFDYNCGYCKRGLHDVVKLVETDPKVRVVFKELPILSKGSEEASRVALAAQRQGKYWELHKAMLGAKGQMNEAAALQIAEKLGLDMTKLKADMASPEVKAEVDKSEALAKKMGVNGTPHFLIGDRAIAGAPEDLYDQLAKNVGELRKQGCSYC